MSLASQMPTFQHLEIPKLESGLHKILRTPPYEPAFPVDYTKVFASETPRPKSIKTTKANPYPGQYFKLLEFKIMTRYKNLEDFYIDFRNTTSYCTFIGLNGSGKSNVIEAISAVFYSLYRLASLRSPKKTDHCPFDYQISYIHNERLIEIENGKTNDGKKVTEDILPKNVIVNYSGEENRLWRQYYEPIY